MPKSQRQKEKILHIYRMLMEQTDENHGLTVQEIISRLEAEGISAERKSIYADLETLEGFGCDICKVKTNTVSYYIGSRSFELAELKLLVDSIQSSKFITAKKSHALIKKLESLCSTYQGKQLQRQVYVANRVKNQSETIYYAVDRIHEAISSDRQINFRYMEWTISDGAEKIVKRQRREGKVYCVSPWALTWDDENYYLVGFDSLFGEIRHYRVDKMEKVEISKDARDGRELFEKFDMAVYTKSIFGMFGGEAISVKLRFHNSLIGVVADRFGKDIFITRDGGDHFVTTVKVALSRQFYGWIFALSDRAQILSPSAAVEGFREEIRRVSCVYGE
ncbi:MAG: helix-turn-helix transcriptional regulator [Ruminococcus sp.]